MTIKSTICAVPECDNPRDLKQRSSLCIMHRVRRSRFKSLNLPTNLNEIKISFEDLKINYNSKSKGKVCCISNCTTKVYKHGKICSKHHWRKRKFGSYDLPNHIGEPSIPIIIKLPPGIVNKWKKHGYLKIEETYERKYKQNTHYKCKQCILSLNIKRKYEGMNNLDDYESLLKLQKGCCAICKGQNNTTRNGKIKRFNIDHCHKTNKVRALLCSFCNSLIGYAKDEIEILESAITYLKSHQWD